MTLLETLSGDLKEAMRAKNEIDLSVLRMLMTAIKNRQAAIGNIHEALTSEQEIEVLKSEIKKRRDSNEAYVAAGRSELAEREVAEISVLERYMPAQASDDQIDSVVTEVMASMPEASAKDFGRLMGQAMAKLKGQADGDRVSSAVKKALS